MQGNEPAEVDEWAYPMHTQVIIEYFHGNWAKHMANSGTTTMYC